ncbi:phosphate ABC transporter permease PstA [Geminocystis herdmanii]|uniref:phosphate ABC transporter permease PstA n=1 Tax=Geminocystis herdmanii TaxID=669359 RepID=UPI0003485480|nr:phosphate ABC transporter permease PstA [Geminocystis herdmanii]
MYKTSSVNLVKNPKSWQEICFTILGFIPIIITFIIFSIFITQTWQFFQEISIFNFFTSKEWTPNYSNAQFGIIVLLSGTFLVTLISLIIAIPLGILAGIYLAEYASNKWRGILKISLESLNGIPGVVYGYFALLFLTPFLQSYFFPSLGGFNALSAGICIGILIIPIIASLTEDALISLSPELRNSGYALALTKQEVIRLILLPAIFPKVLSAITLATSVAVGETMIVSIASGQKPNLTLNPFDSIETITSFIIRVSLGTVEFDSIMFKTIFTVGFILFLATFFLNTFSYWLQNREEKSENKSSFKEKISSNYVTNNSENKYILPIEKEIINLHSKISLPRIILDQILKISGFCAGMIGIVFLIILLWDVGEMGLHRINWTFLTSFSSRRVEESGILAGLVGSVWLFILSLIMVVPLGVGSAIYLEEYRKNNALNRFLEVSIANLAAIPSIIYGLLGLEIFVRLLKPVTGGYSILSGALVLTVMTLPTLIITSRSALKHVGKTLRQGGYAVGMTKEQVLQQLVIPRALPSIITGVLIAQIRALAETAALIGVGAKASVRFLPPLSWEGLTSSYTTLPVQIFYWLQNPKEEIQSLAAAAIIVLVVILLILNLISLLIRASINN